MNTVTFAPRVIGVGRESNWKLEDDIRAEGARMHELPPGEELHRCVSRFTLLAKLLRNLCAQNGKHN